MKIYNPTGKKLSVGRDAIGSNQYVRIIKKRRHTRIRGFMAVFTIAASVIIPLASPFDVQDPFKAAYAPTVRTAYAQPLQVTTVTPSPILNSESKQISDYVKEVFGKDADKAFKILSCENKGLNPKAVNKAGNIPEGSRDIGVFQINEYWQDVNAKFLFDYKINVQIAHKIFKDSGNSFKMWSCSKKVGTN